MAEKDWLIAMHCPKCPCECGEEWVLMGIGICEKCLKKKQNEVRI
jgi:reverse gyrase